MADFYGKSIDFGRNPARDLPDRFEIRRLSAEHVEWAASIVSHSNVFRSPVWSVCYPNGKSARAVDCLHTADYLCRHQVNSGMSFGVFDKHYKFKRPESAATGGKLYWDSEGAGATEDQLIEQMDFPLVSVAMSYDLFEPFDMSRIAPLIATLPLFGTAVHILEERDPRDPASWAATSPRQVLMRNATSTRKDYEGMGVMKALAHFLMREAKLSGYRQISIDAFNNAVTKVWSNPPPPFTSETISSLDMAKYEETNDKGEKVALFSPCTMKVHKINIHLV